MRKSRSFILIGTMLPFVGAALPPELPVDRVFGVYPDGRNPVPFNQSDRLLAQSPLGFLRVYDPAGGFTNEFSLNESARAFALSPDDQTVYALTYSHLLAVRVSDGQRLLDVPFTPLQEDGLEWRVKVSPDATFLVLLETTPYPYGTGRIRCVNTSDFTTLHEETTDKLSPVAAIDAAGRFVYTIIDNEVIRVAVDSGNHSTVTFSPVGLATNDLQYDGTRLLAISSTDSYANYPAPTPFPPYYEVTQTHREYLQDVTAGGDQMWVGEFTQLMDSKTPATGEFPSLFRGVLSRDGSMVFNTRGQVIRTETNTVAATFAVPAAAGMSMSGERVAARSADDTTPFYLYNLTGTPSRVAEILPLRFLTSSPAGADGELLVGKLFDNSRALFDQEGVLLRTLDCAGDSHSCIDVDGLVGVPGTGYAVAGGESLRIWDTASGALLHDYFYRGLSPLVTHVTPSADGTRIALTRRVFAPGCDTPDCPILGTHLEVFDTQALAGGTAEPLVSIEQFPTHALWRAVALSPANDRLYAYAASPAAGNTYDLLLCHDTADGTLLDSAQIQRGTGVHIPEVSLSLADSGEGLAMGCRSILNPAGVWTGGTTLYDPLDLGSSRVLSSDPTVSVAVTADGALLLQRVDLRVRAWDVRAGTVAAASNITESADQVPIALADHETKLLTHSGSTVIRWSLDIPELGAVRAREAVLTSSGDIAHDRNGDGILDSADLVYTVLR